MLADEPTGNLDGCHRQAGDGSAVRAVARADNTTLILITHDMGLAERCDRVLRIADGLLVDADASPARARRAVTAFTCVSPSRLARREMRSGLGGFRLFIACLALGVGAIAAILSFSRAIEEGLRADAREILGGDVAISLLYRERRRSRSPSCASRASSCAGSTAAPWRDLTKPDGRPTLVQLKAVEPAYPLYGKVEMADGGTLANALGKRDGVWGAAVEESALRRMNMAPGDRLKVGDSAVEVRGIIAREPDRGLNAFASLGPRLMIPLDAALEAGLVQPGSLLTWEYRLRLPPGRFGQGGHRANEGPLSRCRLAGEGASTMPAAASASGSTG
jgi:predicted lysophospholipase L1 biosynthesis ABC-type transport system permease subunit